MHGRHSPPPVHHGPYSLWDNGGIDAVTAALPIGVFETDVNCRLTAANDAFRDLALGGAPLQKGTAPWSNAAPHERTECERLWLAHRQDGTDFSVDFRVASPSGETVWVRIRTVATVESGRTVGYVGTAVDVTPAVEQSSLSDQLVGLLDVSGEAVVIFDRTGAPTFVNDTARTMIGVEPGGGPASDVAARTYMQAVRDQLPRYMLGTSTTGDNKWSGENPLRSLARFGGFFGESLWNVYGPAARREEARHD